MAKKTNKKFQGLHESDWVRVEYQPRVELIEVFEIEGNTISGDIDGFQNGSRNIEAKEIKTLTKVDPPRKLELADQEIFIFDDGRAVIDGREMTKTECLKFFKALGDKLGYDVAA